MDGQRNSHCKSISRVILRNIEVEMSHCCQMGVNGCNVVLIYTQVDEDDLEMHSSVGSKCRPTKGY